MQSWAYQARANESISTCNAGGNPPVEFWAAFNSLTNRSMFFDEKQLPDLKSGPWIYLGAVKQLRNSLSSCGNTSQNER